MSFVIWLHDRVQGREAGFAYALASVVAAACWAVTLYGGDVVRSLDEGDFLLTPLTAFGAGLMEARLVNGVLVGLGLVLLFQLVRRHAGELAGLLSVAMVSAWPVVIYTASTLYPQTLAAFLLVLTLWLLDGLRDRTGLRPVVLGGLAFGAFILTIPVALLLVPVFVVWIAVNARRPLVAVLVFGIVSASLVGSWTVRNWFAFDSFVPVATSSGFNLLAGNSPETRWNSSLEVRFPDHVYTELTGKNEVERNDIMTRAALDEITGDPARFLRLWAAKFVHWFHFSNRLLSDELLESGASSIQVGLRDLILFAAWRTLIVAPLLCRIAMLRRVPFRKIEVLFVVLWIAAGLAYALFFTRVRFRLPFDWLILSVNAMFIAVLLEEYLARLRRR